MLGGGRYSILFPPFGGLVDEMPPILPFLCLCLEQLVTVRVNGGGMCDGLGRGSDQER